MRSSSVELGRIDISSQRYSNLQEFRPTKVDVDLHQDNQFEQQKHPDDNLNPDQTTKLKEHFARQQLSPTPHTFIHLVRLKYFPSITLQLDFDDLLPNEAALLDSLKPLLGGVEVFRKLLTGSGINSRLFDPMKNSGSNPEILGYAFRTLRIVPELTHFEIRKIDKLQHVEGVFELSEFVKQDIHPNSRDGVKKQTSLKKAEIKYQAFNWVFRNIAVDLVVMNDTTIKVITKAAASLLKANKALIEKISSRIRSLEE